MKLIGLMVVRSEAWCLRASIAAAMQWLDGLFILNHASTDETQHIIDAAWNEHRGRVWSKMEEDSTWNEADIRALVLAAGREDGGTHFAVVDADEVLTAGAIPLIRFETLNLPPGELLRLPWIHCWRSLDKYRCDESAFGRARVPLIFADAPGLAYSADADGYQLHKRFPRGLRTRDIWVRDSGRGVLHMQHARWERVVAKQRLYAETEKQRWGKVRANYAAAVDETGLQTEPIPAEWWPIDRALVDLKAEAWQEREVQHA